MDHGHVYGQWPALLSSPQPPGTTNLLGVLWRNKWLVITPVVVSVLLAILFIATAQKRYTSRGIFTVQPAGSRLAGDNGDVGQYANLLYTQRE